MKIILILACLITNISIAKNLGYCPKSTATDCRNSLADALNVITNCPLEKPRTKECAFILVETLSEADPKAPFYEGFYAKNFEIGNVKNYKEQIASLRQYSLHAWLVLHNLAKALILNYVDIPSLTEEQKREIRNLVQPVFTVTEGRTFDINDKSHVRYFIQKQLEMAKAIKWGTPQQPNK
ncbi:MAG: hypothetical protein H6925_02125 [Holosporaceae bacterium]|nr:MAG: hypothetical protein H6925_02125 [Holosporaceae bacterium]